MIDYLQYVKDNTSIDLELINNKLFDFTMTYQEQYF